MIQFSVTGTPLDFTTTLIATTVVLKVLEDLLLVLQALETNTKAAFSRHLFLSYRGAQATLAVVSAENALAFATDLGVLAKATQALTYNSLNLLDLKNERNLYKTELLRFGNIWYLTIFLIIMVYLMLMLIKSRYWWFNITMICGYSLEWMGFLGRVLSFRDTSTMDYYLLQYVALTIAPAFIMAAIYFLFAQIVVIHGREYLVLKPMWYLYFFVACDVLLLMVQAGGGGAASAATNNGTDPDPGINTMIAGIAFQVFLMSVFLVFWFEFLHRIWFRHGTGEYSRRSLANIWRFLINAKSIRPYREEVLETRYNAKFTLIRHRKLFNYLPLAVTVAVLVVYIRLIYRVVELAQGFTGYLITHEVYLFVLDAMMISICGLIFLPFHPVWSLGTKIIVRLATIKKNEDEVNVGDEMAANEKLSRSLSGDVFGDLNGETMGYELNGVNGNPVSTELAVRNDM